MSRIYFWKEGHKLDGSSLNWEFKYSPAKKRKNRKPKTKKSKRNKS